LIHFYKRKMICWMLLLLLSTAIPSSSGDSSNGTILTAGLRRVSARLQEATDRLREIQSKKESAKEDRKRNGSNETNSHQKGSKSKKSGSDSDEADAEKKRGLGNALGKYVNGIKQLVKKAQAC